MDTNILRVVSKLALFIAICLNCYCAISNSSVNHSSPKEWIAASASLADVRAAVSAANPGDTVIVPAGTVIWYSQLAITKSVSLIGAGSGSTIIIGGFSRTDNTNNSLLSYDVQNDSVKSFRISSLTLSGGGMCEPLRIDNDSSDGFALRLRIDHCTFQNSSSSLYWQQGTVYGVVDNCIFDGGTDVGNLMIYGNNATSWTHTSYDFGNADNLYFEDCTFNWSSMPFQGGGGGRYAVRHCTFNHTLTGSGTAWGFDMHGNYAGGNWSGFGVEVYENTWNMNGRSALLIDMRGGKGLIYNNFYVNAGSYISSRVADEENDANNLPAVSPINGQPQHVSDFYIWNIYRNGTKYSNGSMMYVGQTVAYADGVVPRRDVNFWEEVSSFDGTTGMGSGPLSSRPSLCTLEGATWWATDESKLYRWHQGAWELYYTPYTYPHPLRKLLSD